MIDVSQVESRFFVRMKGSYTESLAKVEEVFGTIDAKVVAEVGKEFGFITSKMKEEEYRAKASHYRHDPGSLLRKKNEKMTCLCSSEKGLRACHFLRGQ